MSSAYAFNIYNSLKNDMDVLEIYVTKFEINSRILILKDIVLKFRKFIGKIDSHLYLSFDINVHVHVQARAIIGSLLSYSNAINCMHVVGANLDQIGMKPFHKPPTPSVLQM